MYWRLEKPQSGFVTICTEKQYRHFNYSEKLFLFNFEGSKLFHFSAKAIQMVSVYLQLKVSPQIMFQQTEFYTTDSSKRENWSCLILDKNKK